MQQRYYDPIAGRFLSVDPVTTDASSGKSFGRYHYAENNPYLFVDPDGRNPIIRLLVGAIKAIARNKTEPKQRGRESEARVLKDMDKTKNTESVGPGDKKSIPDFQDSQQIGEIKDTKRVTDTEQLRIQREAAKEAGKEHVVVTGEKTKVSSTVERESTVVRRSDLGPQEAPKPPPLPEPIPK